MGSSAGGSRKFDRFIDFSKNPVRRSPGKRAASNQMGGVQKKVTSSMGPPALLPLRQGDLQVFDHLLPTVGSLEPHVSSAPLPFASGLSVMYSDEGSKAPIGLVATVIPGFFLHDVRLARVDSNILELDEIKHPSGTRADAIRAAANALRWAKANFAQAVIELETAEARLADLAFDGIRVVLPLSAIPRKTSYPC